MGMIWNIVLLVSRKFVRLKLVDYFIKKKFAIMVQVVVIFALGHQKHIFPPMRSRCSRGCVLVKLTLICQMTSKIARIVHLTPVLQQGVIPLMIVHVRLGFRDTLTTVVPVCEVNIKRTLGLTRALTVFLENTPMFGVR